jgi:hypothetical protein
VKHSGHCETGRTKTNKTTNRNFRRRHLKVSAFSPALVVLLVFLIGAGIPRFFPSDNSRKTELPLVTQRECELPVVGERVAQSQVIDIAHDGRQLGPQFGVEWNHAG